MSRVLLPASVSGSASDSPRSLPALSKAACRLRGSSSSSPQLGSAPENHCLKGEGCSGAWSLHAVGHLNTCPHALCPLCQVSLPLQGAPDSMQAAKQHCQPAAEVTDSKAPRPGRFLGQGTHLGLPPSGVLFRSGRRVSCTSSKSDMLRFFLCHRPCCLCSWPRPTSRGLCFRCSRLPSLLWCCCPPAGEGRDC